MEDYYGANDLDFRDDDQSVGSLAHLDETDQNNESNETSKNTPEGVVREKSKAIARIKYIFIILLFSAGAIIILSIFSSGDTADEDEQGVEKDSTTTTTQAIIAGAIFTILILIFFRYDFLVSRRNKIVLDMANKSKHIVDQLFPEGVRDRLMDDQESRRSSRGGSNADGDDPLKIEEADFQKLTELNTLQNSNVGTASPSRRMRNTDEDGASAAFPLSPLRKTLKPGVSPARESGHPIADNYPHCTVLFADLAGFTGWASERDPAQVFFLLETVYAAFDEIGKMLKVFKVETIGDCYLAVTGLPEPDDAHAINMARFAFQCLQRMGTVTSELENELGPGTNKLTVRIGLHSGSVTAGVLRGQKSRFQLFGDTVNTASRMESTGVPGRIQVSEETAELLRATGKPHWLQERSDRVSAKGKGELRTFWLDPIRKETGTQGSPLHTPTKKNKGKLGNSYLPQISLSPENRLKQRSNASLQDATLSSEMQARNEKLINWNTEIILKYLGLIANSTQVDLKRTKSIQKINHSEESSDLAPPITLVSDCIILPPLEAFAHGKNPSDLKDVSSLRNAVHSFVTEISLNYNCVAFHNFEHASHVTMAVNKLLERVTVSKRISMKKLHRRSFGISSDPITQLAIIIAALVHDVGHTGIPNAQLVKEKDPLAVRFKNQSVAEQFAVAKAWEILMKKRYTDLRKAIYTTNVERKRFRQVLVNAVLATDISDRSLNQERGRKWDKAFIEDDSSGSLSQVEMNRRATVVLEHLIQVADVSHTMQHWAIYRRWNTRLFEEMSQSYLMNRAAFNPADTWLKGEAGFFDFYVIPLATKMRDSGVFGSSGDQYLKGAKSNRNEWESSGQREVDTMISEFQTSNRSSCSEVSDDDENSIMEGYEENRSVIEILSFHDSGSWA